MVDHEFLNTADRSEGCRPFGVLGENRFDVPVEDVLENQLGDFELAFLNGAGKTYMWDFHLLPAKSKYSDAAAWTV